MSNLLCKMRGHRWLNVNSAVGYRLADSPDVLRGMFGDAQQCRRCLTTTGSGTWLHDERLAGQVYWAGCNVMVTNNVTVPWNPKGTDSP